MTSDNIPSMQATLNLAASPVTIVAIGEETKIIHGAGVITVTDDEAHYFLLALRSALSAAGLQAVRNRQAAREAEDRA